MQVKLIILDDDGKEITSVDSAENSNELIATSVSSLIADNKKIQVVKLIRALLSSDLRTAKRVTDLLVALHEKHRELTRELEERLAWYSGNYSNPDQNDWPEAEA